MALVQIEWWHGHGKCDEHWPWREISAVYASGLWRFCCKSVLIFFIGIDASFLALYDVYSMLTTYDGTNKNIIYGNWWRWTHVHSETALTSFYVDSTSGRVMNDFQTEAMKVEIPWWDFWVWVEKFLKHKRSICNFKKVIIWIVK